VNVAEPIKTRFYRSTEEDDCTILSATIEKGGKSVNITKLMALMGLGVKQGDTVTVTCEGADEDKASEALKAFFEETL